MLAEQIVSKLGNLSTSQGNLQKTAGPKDKMGRDEFLKLLMAQIKYQDPMNPMDSTQFSAQLAQFSSLEQLLQANEALKEIQNSLAEQKSSNILDYIGKKAKIGGNSILIKDQKAEPFSYTLMDNANVSVVISGDRGLEVRRMDLGWQSKGQQVIPWDGKNNRGARIEDGTYTFEVLATDANGQPVSYEAHRTAEITGVVYDNGEPRLKIGNDLINPENILEITKSE